MTFNIELTLDTFNGIFQSMGMGMSPDSIGRYYDLDDYIVNAILQVGDCFDIGDVIAIDDHISITLI